MDDIFFTDSKNRSSRSEKPRSPSKDRFSDETAVSPGSSRLRDEDRSDENFVVRIPQEESDLFTPQSRTPRGRPVANQSVFTSGAPKRTPQEGSDIYSSSFPGRTPSGKRLSNTPSSAAASQNRTPSGKRLGAAQKETAQQAAASAAPSVGAETPAAKKSAPKNTSEASKKHTAVPASGTPQKPSGQARVPQKSGKVKSASPVGPKKKRGRGFKIFVAVVCIIAVLLGGVFAYGYSLLGKISYDTKKLEGNEYISDSKLAKSSDVRNILFMGSDARGDVSGQRSDTMILCSIDRKHKKLKLTSFLRDSYVFLPSGKYYNKLNATFSYGGVQYTADTLEYNFKVKIDDYIIVDFEAFVKLIDMMGGLTVTGVTESEAKYLRETVKILYAKKGTNKFSGAATLWYCRIRYLDNDFKRTERQRKVISAMISQLKKTSPAKLIEMMETVLPMIQTNISRNSLVSLGVGAVFSYLRYDIIQHQVPAEGTWNSRSVPGIGDVLEMDIDKNAELLKKFIYNSDKPVKSK